MISRISKVPDAILLYRDWSREETTSGYSQQEFLVQSCLSGFAKAVHLTERVATEQHGLQSH